MQNEGVIPSCSTAVGKSLASDDAAISSRETISWFILVNSTGPVPKAYRPSI